MFEAYKIGVAIHLTNHVSGALSSLIKDFAKTDAQAALLQKRLDSIKNGMKGGLIATGAGLAMAAAFKPAIDEAMKFERAMLRIRDIGGISGEMVQKVRNEALRGAYKGIGAAESVDLFRDLHAAFGDAHEAEKFMPVFAAVARITQGKYGKSAVQGEEDVKALGRVAERRGGTKSAESMEGALDLMLKMQNASGGAVTPKDLLAFTTQMGAMGNLMSNDGMLQMWALMQEQGGSKAGTALNSGFQNLLLGRGTENSGFILHKMGWVDEAKNEANLKQMYGENWSKHRNKVTADALKDADLAKSMPVAWMIKDGIPLINAYLDKQGIKDPKKRESETISLLAQGFSNRKGADSFALIATQLSRIMKDYHIALESPGIKKSIESYDASPMAKFQELHAKWEIALTNLGEAALPVLIPLVNKLAAAFREFNEYAQKNPDSIRTLTKGLLDLSAVLITLGGMTVFVNGMRAIGVVVELLSGPAGLAAVRIGLRGLLGPIGLLITAFEGIFWLSDKLKKRKVKDSFEDMNPDYHKPVQPNSDSFRTEKGEAERRRLEKQYNIVPPASATNSQSSGDVYLDREKVGVILNRYQAKQLGRQPTGPRTYDPTISLFPVSSPLGNN